MVKQVFLILVIFILTSSVLGQKQGALNSNKDDTSMVGLVPDNFNSYTISSAINQPHTIKDSLGNVIDIGIYYNADNLAKLASYEHLERVYIIAKDSSRIDLTQLAECKNMRELQIIAIKPQEVDIVMPVEWEKIEKFYIYLRGKPNILPNPTRGYSMNANLSYTNFQTKFQITPFGNYKNLELINISSKGIMHIDITPFTNIEALKTLNLSNCYLKQDDIQELEKLINIEELKFYCENLPMIDISSLGNCKSLKSLEITSQLNRTNRFEKMDPNPQSHIFSLSPLSKCKDLETLSIDNSSLLELDLKPLKKCKKLTKLKLYAIELQSVDLSPLRKCQNLKELILYGNELKELDLSPLSNCVNLELLDLRGNQIETLDLSPLENCKKLRKNRNFY